jgi:hypothetical protein
MDIIFWTGMFGELSRTIGCYQLAHWLRKHSYDCQVIDFVHKLTYNELFNFTKKFITDKTICIGLSSTFWAEDKLGRLRNTNEIPLALKKVMLMIKDEYPNIKFVLGGSQADNQSSETIKLFDLVVSGAGEDVLLEYLNDVRKNKKFVFSFETKYGTPYRTGSLNNKFNIQENDHIFLEQDCIIEGETLPIEISRGCIFKCSYCQYPYIGKKKLDYVRHIDYIKNELEHNHKNFKTKNYYVIDDTFNDTPDKMNMWFECVESLDFDIEYTTYMRADLLSRNEYQIEKFKESGLASVFFGIESFHPIASKIVGKGWSGKEGKTFLTELKRQWKNDVTIHLSLIVGFPHETQSDYEETQAWCNANNIDSWTWQSLYINTAQRLFSSEFDRTPEKFGYTIRPDGGWNNDFYSSESALSVAQNLLKGRNRLGTQKVTTWKMLYWMSMGFDSYFLKNTFEKDIKTELLKMKEHHFLKTYKEKLNAISA